MAVTFEQDAVFIGANKQSFVVDYDYDSNIVAYGAGKTVALWKPTGNNNTGVIATLKKHTKEITCVRFIPNSDFLITGAEDYEINVWKRHGDEFELSQTLTEHKGSITCVAVLNQDIFVTGGSDGQVIIWGFDTTWKCVHEFVVKPGFFPLSLALEQIKQGQYILTVGGTNVNLYVFTFTYNNSDISSFMQSAVLTGHEDWIKCLAFIKDSEDEYLLASGSQDRYIRLWRLRLNEKIDNSDEDTLKLILLSNKQYKFAVEQTKCAISFEALIMGHDDWVTGLSWHPSYARSESKEGKKLQLLSSSADTALMIWEMDYESGIWVCISRLGELSIKGASTATGASGGFWSCTWFKQGDDHYILTNGRTGSIRVYKSQGEDTKNWDSQLSLTGPTREITDLVWSLNGEYFMTTSLDQTTRLIAPWKHDNTQTWHEFARPQIHGYDMTCIDNISPTKFVSAGDEKILRVFEMTHSISKSLKDLSGISIETKEELPDTASLPVLGLSNKAANEQLEVGEASQQQEDAEQNVELENKKEDVLEGLTTPPLEDHLQRFTLFPEIEKLYGHGYEVTCCATSPNGKLIATACKSNSVKHGMLRIFNITKDFQQCAQTLPGHNLTVTNISFSPDGKYLLSVSRDRQFFLWEVINEDTGEFKLIDNNTKAHNRIIWDCCWVPPQFGHYFVTVGRDKMIKLWNCDAEPPVSLVTQLKIEEVVTSVDILDHLVGDKLIIAVGLENGSIQIISTNLKEAKELEIVGEINTKISPADKVTSLKFSTVNNTTRLAVGSADSSIRLYHFSV